MSSSILAQVSRRQLRRSYVQSSRFHRFTAPAAVLPAKFIRHASASASDSSSSWNFSKSRVSTIFYGLILLGVASTSYGLYQFYSILTMWPEEVRSDLRSALKARHKGDPKLSAQYFLRAYQTALTLPQSAFDPLPKLKISGILLAAADALEHAQEPQIAFLTYGVAFSTVDDVRSREEILRAIAIASKLAALAEALGMPVEEEERWHKEATSRIAGVLVTEQLQKTKAGADYDANGAKGVPQTLGELEVPEWADEVDVMAPFEQLGSFYARTGRVLEAKTIYEGLAEILSSVDEIKPKEQAAEDLCRAAQLMNNRADLALRPAPTPEAREEAREWALRALSTLDKAQSPPTSAKGKLIEPGTCDITRVAVLFNLGSFAEMAGDLAASKEYFLKSLVEAKRIGMKEGIMEGQAALRRLEEASRKSGSKAIPAPEPASATS